MYTRCRGRRGREQTEPQMGKKGAKEQGKGRGRQEAKETNVRQKRGVL